MNKFLSVLSVFATCLSYRPHLQWLKIRHAKVKKAVSLIAAMVSLSVKMDQSVHLRKFVNRVRA